MSDSFRRLADAAKKAADILPPVPAQPIAGYLPAPSQPRFTSGAERAAQGIKTPIKAESIRNTLIKGGAKPVELDYAGIDDFMKSRVGQKVSPQDIFNHINTNGPLGRIYKVEQQRPEAWGTQHETPEKLDLEGQINRDRDMAEYKGVGPLFSDIRSPFDADTAQPSTEYHMLTELGKKSPPSYDGYREVLFSDPSNDRELRDRRFGNFLDEIGNEKHINPHSADYWLRYHSLPNEIHVTNIQSDVGQDWSKTENAIRKHGRPLTQAEIANAERRMEELEMINGYEDKNEWPAEHREEHQRLHEAWSRPSETEISDAENSIEALYMSYGSDESKWPEQEQAKWRQLHDIVYHPAVYNAPPPHTTEPTSILAKDDHWKNVLARQLIMQSAVEGKPITLPTGQSANNVEGMPVAAAERLYSKDMPDRILKILKGIDPAGVGANVRMVEPRPDWKALSGEGSYRKAFTLDAQDLGTDQPPYWIDGQSRSAIQQTADDAISAYLDKVDPNLDPRSASDQRLERYVSNGLFDVVAPFSSVGRLERRKIPNFDTNKLYAAAKDPRLLADDPEAIETITKVLSAIELARSRGVPALPGSKPPFLKPPSKPFERPGTHIELTPTARRHILDNGIDIITAGGLVGAGALSGLNQER